MQRDARRTHISQDLSYPLALPAVKYKGASARCHMKTQGEIEAAVCAGIARFEQDYMGRGPKDIHAYLIGDLLIVRLKGVLTVAEQQLVASFPAEKGRDLLKQVRIHLVETARPILESLIHDVTGTES